MPGKIFISYRRDDAGGTAGRLYDAIERKLGRSNLFFDVDAIRPGYDFHKEIATAVGRCDAMLVVVGKNWLGTNTASGVTRRIDDPNDFVRLEVQFALARQIPIIPVCVEGALVPASESLPRSIQALTRYQSIRLTPERFHQDASGLLQALDVVLAEQRKRHVKNIWQAVRFSTAFGITFGASIFFSFLAAFTTFSGLRLTGFPVFNSFFLSAGISLMVLMSAWLLRLGFAKDPILTKLLILSMNFTSTFCSCFFSYAFYYTHMAASTIHTIGSPDNLSIAFDGLINGDRSAYAALSVAIIVDLVIIISAFLSRGIKGIEERHTSRGAKADNFYQDTPTDGPGISALKFLGRNLVPLPTGGYQIDIQDRTPPREAKSVSVAVEWMKLNLLLKQSSTEAGVAETDELGLMYLESELALLIQSRS